MDSYFASFLLALVVHVLFFISWNSIKEKPRYGIHQGLSSLEIIVAEKIQKEEENPLFKEKKFLQHQQGEIFQQPKGSLSLQKEHTLSSSKNFLSTVSSASSGALEATPSYLKNPQPLYPHEEREAGHQGVVLLHATLNAQGRIVHLEVIHSSGYPKLDQQAALTVGKSWLFRPAYQHGHAVCSEILIPIHFSLQD